MPGGGRCSILPIAFLSEGDAKTMAQRLPDFLELANVSAAPGKVKYLFVSLPTPFQNGKAALSSTSYQHEPKNARTPAPRKADTAKVGLMLAKTGEIMLSSGLC